MKKIILAFLSIAFAICILGFSGCLRSENEFIGRAEIQSVVDAAANFDSARYVITNLQTGEVQEIFSFYYKEDKTQIWLDEKEFYNEATGVTESSYQYYDGVNVTDSDGNAAAATYNRDEPYSMSTGVLLFFLPDLVASGTSTVTDDGFTVYTQEYDMERLHEKTNAMAGAVSFKTTYLFDTDGEFLAMTEHIAYENKDPSDYQIEIIDINNVTAVSP
ncbi:MAG: hypothetical protein LBM41_01345 [Ruminococcus sp.]|nr:hypothetical protein [Ruminococcus sp.]